MSRGKGRVVCHEVREVTGARFYSDCSGMPQESIDQRRLVISFLFKEPLWLPLGGWTVRRKVWNREKTVVGIEVRADGAWTRVEQWKKYIYIQV